MAKKLSSKFGTRQARNDSGLKIFCSHLRSKISLKSLQLKSRPVVLNCFLETGIAFFFTKVCQQFFQTFKSVIYNLVKILFI